MLISIKKGLTRVGVDGAIFYTVIWRVVVAFGGIGTIFFIVRFLSGTEQGYYYTFASLLTVQFFFELGLTNVITQFVAHENSFLTWETSNGFHGPEEYLSRLSSLLRFTIKWFLIISLLSFVTISIAGYIFFTAYKKGHIVNWKGPYILLCFTTAASLNSLSVLAFFEGLGKVQEVAKVKLIQQLIYLLLVFIFFVSGLKLYASPLASAAALVFVVGYILTADRIKILKDLWSKLTVYVIDYRKEIFPFQWRIAVSLLSSYLMYQLFNPVLFAVEGPIVAGQMGLSLTAINGILFIGMAWVNTKIPLFSRLVAQRKFNELDVTFKFAVNFALVISVSLILLMISFVAACNYYRLEISYKFLGIVPLTLLAAAMLTNNMIVTLATYLRSHKKEPFLYLSIVLGILTTCSTILFGNFAGVMGITISFAALIIFVGLTWAIVVFNRKRREWHNL